MAITVKHSKVSTIPDDADTNLVRPSDWNADHSLVGTIDVANGGTGASTASGGLNNLLPSQTSNTGKVLTTDGTNASWATNGSGTVTSVGGTGTVSGIALSGTVTSSGNLTLGGTLDLSSPPAIGGTTPAAGTFTTITGQTEVLKGTGNNLFLQSNTFTTTWSISNVTLTSGQSDPFGGSTAYLVNNGTNTGTHPVSQTVTISPNTYTFSVYAKAGTANFLALFSSSSVQGAFFNLTTGAFTGNMINAPASYASTSVGSGWYRLSITVASTGSSSTLQLLISEDGTNYSYTGTSKTITIYGAQLEIGSVTNTYIPTTTTAIYGTPTLSFSGVAGLGLQSNGSLYVSPAGTGALQAQATTSTATGGNIRGAQSVDWQMARDTAARVASGDLTVIGGGYGNTANGFQGAISGGTFNTISSVYNFIGAGYGNSANSFGACIVGGYTNTAAGYFNVIGGGFTNSGTSASAVTTQSGTMNGTTAVTLSGSNANIKVGQYITGTSIADRTYVAAISGTSLTLSQNASGSSTSTLSFYTPHGVVVGGGNNQATGSYSFIGGGGDAGTAANRNVASGAWSAVVSGIKNTASGLGSFVGGGGTDGTVYPNTASGTASTIVGGVNNNAGGGYSFVGGGYTNNSNSSFASVIGGALGTTRSITGYTVFPACFGAVSYSSGNSQAALLILGKETTNATATVLTSDGSGASGTNQVILPNNSAYYFRGEVVSGVTGGGNTKGWYVEGVIKRGAGVGTTALVGTPTVTSNYADAGASTWTIAVTADTTNGGLAITFTGQASTTIRTVCQIRTTEMTY